MVNDDPICFFLTNENSNDLFVFFISTQSAKSGDSSGYYSSRATGTLTGTASSTDISPTFDESMSILDNFHTGDIYMNTVESTNDHDNLNQGLEHDVDDLKLSLDSEVSFLVPKPLFINIKLSGGFYFVL